MIYSNKRTTEHKQRNSRKTSRKNTSTICWFIPRNHALSAWSSLMIKWEWRLCIVLRHGEIPKADTEVIHLSNTLCTCCLFLIWRNHCSLTMRTIIHKTCERRSDLDILRFLGQRDTDNLWLKFLRLVSNSKKTECRFEAVVKRVISTTKRKSKEMTETAMKRQ